MLYFRKTPFMTILISEDHFPMQNLFYCIIESAEEPRTSLRRMHFFYNRLIYDVQEVCSSDPWRPYMRWGNDRLQKINDLAADRYITQQIIFIY